MTGEELFLNELNFHIRQGISKKDLTDLINERLKQLNIPVVVQQSDLYTYECKVCGKPFGDELSLYEHYDEEHN